jgi:hypothetical protein
LLDGRPRLDLGLIAPELQQRHSQLDVYRRARLDLIGGRERTAGDQLLSKRGHGASHPVLATLRVRRRITHESWTHKIEWVARSLQIRVVLGALVRRVRGLALRMAKRAEEAMRTIARPAPVVGGLVRDAVRSRDELIAENALLRQ